MGIAIEAVPMTYAEWRRFISFITVPDDPDACWIWNGSRTTKQGYGRMYFRGLTVVCSRLMYAMAHGPLGADEMACHHCDNPPCCNPFHLFRGTNRQNQLDASRKGRSAMQRPEVAAKFHVIADSRLEEIVGLLNSGVSGRQLARDLGLGVNAVNRFLRRHGIPNNTKPGKRSPAPAVEQPPNTLPRAAGILSPCPLFREVSPC